jgi:hypothetical protein
MLAGSAPQFIQELPPEIITVTTVPSPHAFPILLPPPTSSVPVRNLRQEPHGFTGGQCLCGLPRHLHSHYGRPRSVQMLLQQPWPGLVQPNGGPAQQLRCVVKGNGVCSTPGLTALMLQHVCPQPSCPPKRGKPTPYALPHPAASLSAGPKRQPLATRTPSLNLGSAGATDCKDTREWK